MKLLLQIFVLGYIRIVLDFLLFLNVPLIQLQLVEIPYHEALTRIALPYGLASDVYRDADDNYRVKKFRDLYIAALEEAVRGEGETVVDVYA